MCELISAIVIHAWLITFHFSSRSSQIRSTDCFQRWISLKKWARKDFSRMQLRWRNILIVWRAETREERTKRDLLEEFWEWKRTKGEKCTRLPQQNWLSTLQSFFALLDVKMKIMDPQVYDVSSPALKGVWRKMTTLWVSSMTNNLNCREKVYDLVAWISACI